MRRGNGFTLVEVLVALAVLAVGLMAALTAIGQLTANEAYLRDRTLATWVAHNRLVEEQLSVADAQGELKGVTKIYLEVLDTVDEEEARRFAGLAERELQGDTLIINLA